MTVLQNVLSPLTYRKSLTGKSWIVFGGKNGNVRVAAVNTEDNAMAIVRSYNFHNNLINTLHEGDDIISGLEAACDQAGVDDLVEVRDWWRKVEILLEKVKVGV